MDLNNETFLVTFNNDQDYLNALTGGPWVILDHYLIVHQWSPSFRTSDKPHRSVVAWIQLPELPVHFYHREVLFALGNLIGRTVKLDYHTEHLERGKFARLAVELDMSKPLATRIRLDGFWQQVIYENLPEICFNCGRIGHREASCPNNPGTPATSQSSSSIPSQPAQSPEPAAGYGPWMQVMRKSRKPNRKGAQNQNTGSERNKGGNLGKEKSKVMAPIKEDHAGAKASKEGKGKANQKSEPKKGISCGQNGKVIGESSTSSQSQGNQAGLETRVWRAIGPQADSKAPLTHLGLTHQGTSGPNQTDPSAGIPMDTASPKPTPGNSLPPMVIPDEMKNRVATTPDLQKPSIRHHYQGKKAKKDSEPPLKEKMACLQMRPAKKPPNSPSLKKKLKKRVQESSLQINPQAIADFVASSLLKAKEFHNQTGVPNKDVLMLENQEPIVKPTQPENLESLGQPAIADS
ncbi:unnamed protein product [Linum tenue]|uniref:CCHC-type domain-containing protein n=1 Tax=Linum tenue TaxID=586396 RepID=A0AAV0LSF0_9ROSI|nr:unnamed protein product [Linum tenue]